MKKKMREFIKKYKYYILIPFILVLMLTALILFVSIDQPITPFGYAVR